MEERVDIYADFAFDVLTLTQAAKQADSDKVKARYMEKVVETAEAFCLKMLPKLEDK